MRSLAALAALGLAGCAYLCPSGEPPLLATARVAQDFDTYTLRRVGLLPLTLADPAGISADSLQEGFYAELSRSTPFEVVRLQRSDLEQVPDSDPYRNGRYGARTVVELASRYSLDAILFGTVTDQQFFPPQRLSVQVDLVAAETGLVLWSSAVHLDASDPRVLEGLEGWAAADGARDDWEVALLSPARFARYAAWQVAQLL